LTGTSLPSSPQGTGTKGLKLGYQIAVMKIRGWNKGVKDDDLDDHSLNRTRFMGRQCEASVDTDGDDYAEEEAVGIKHP
jgi:hypothetical protein